MTQIGKNIKDLHEGLNGKEPFDSLNTKTRFPKKKVTKFCIFVLLGSLWVYLENLPVIPIGGIICVILLLLRIKTKEIFPYVIVLLACIIGFVGTGVKFTISEQEKVSIANKKEISGFNFNFGVSIGYSTIDYLINKDRKIIYDDSLCKTTIEKINGFINTFVDNYNTSGVDFVKNNFLRKEGQTEESLVSFIKDQRNKTGKIISHKYLGYLSWVYPDPSIEEFTVIYETQFETPNDYGSMLFRVLLTKGRIQLTKLIFVNKDTKYRIIKGL